MTIESHLEQLVRKHGALETEIAEAMTHPSIDDVVLTDLKRRKLHIKEEIEKLRAQMADLQQLTAENFTKQTGITVNFTVLPENDVRDKISQEFSSQAGQYDVATVSNFEIPIYAKSQWIAPMDDFIAKPFALGDLRSVLSRWIAIPAPPEPA